MKKKNMGFILLETLIVSVFIISTLVYLYIQFINLKQNYDISFRYDTIPGLYNAKNIEKMINEKYGYSVFINNVNKNNNNYIELFNDNKCNLIYFSNNQNYCNKLMENIDAKTVLFTNKNINDINNKFKTNNPYSNDFYLYIKSINQVSNDESYYIIIEYNDNTYSNIKISTNKEEQ